MKTVNVAELKNRPGIPGGVLGHKRSGPLCCYQARTSQANSAARIHNKQVVCGLASSRRLAH
jgi:hypothetical protein